MDMQEDLRTKDSYFSYMLRIWRLKESEDLSSAKNELWRVSLESTKTRKQFMFASLEEMILFLHNQFDQGNKTSDEE